MFGIFNVCNFILSSQNILIYFTDQCDLKIYFLFGVFFLITLLMFGISKYFTTFKEVLYYYFLLDALSLSYIMNSMGFAGVIAII